MLTCAKVEKCVSVGIGRSEDRKVLGKIVKVSEDGCWGRMSRLEV